MELFFWSQYAPKNIFNASTFDSVKHTNQMIAFGIHIRKLREAKGLSQQELAYEADIHQKTIQKIETAKMNPSFDTIISLAEGLDISLSDLLKFDIDQ